MAVDTRGVDSGLTAAERKIKASAARVAAIEQRQASASRLALGKKVGTMALERSGFGGGVGELAGMALGGGGIGLAAAGLAAGFMAFDAASRGLIEAVQGAGAALKQFEETGKQTFAINETVLRGLAKMEERTKGPGLMSGIFQGFQYGRSTVEGEGMFSSLFKDIQASFSGTAAALGAWFQGGSFREGQMATVPFLPAGGMSGLDETQVAIAQALAAIGARRADEQAVIDAKRRDI
jgi:hypothetical protein